LGSFAAIRRSVRAHWLRSSRFGRDQQTKVFDGRDEVGPAAFGSCGRSIGLRANSGDPRRSGAGPPGNAESLASFAAGVAGRHCSRDIENRRDSRFGSFARLLFS
jgi:hypothetical protein